MRLLCKLGFHWWRYFDRKENSKSKRMCRYCKKLVHFSDFDRILLNNRVR